MPEDSHTRQKLEKWISLFEKLETAETKLLLDALFDMSVQFKADDITLLGKFIGLTLTLYLKREEPEALAFCVWLSAISRKHKVTDYNLICSFCL